MKAHHTSISINRFKKFESFSLWLLPYQRHTICQDDPSGECTACTSGSVFCAVMSQEKSSLFAFFLFSLSSSNFLPHPPGTIPPDSIDCPLLEFPRWYKSYAWPLSQSSSENWSFHHNPYHVALDRSDELRFSSPTFSVDIRVHLLSCQFLSWMSAYLVPLLGRHLREHLEKFVRRHMVNKLWALNEEIYSCVPSMEPIRLRQLLSCLNTHADVLNK